MSAKAFVAELAGPKAKIVGGFGAGPNIDPSRNADELFGNDAIPGPWLCCYMLRRFGWPNSGSDDYKELCSWTLTTPMAGLYLGVTPYLGGGNLHFSVRFNKAVQDASYRDPSREEYFARREKVINRWWKVSGSKLYVFGTGKADGDEDELIRKYGSERDGQVYGLWKRATKHRGKNTVIPGGKKYRMMVIWWLGDFIEEKHPEVKLPVFPKRCDRATPMFAIRARAAIKATLRDLIRPTNVRDISFTPFGDIERSPLAQKFYSKQKHADYFPGAGYAPKYWFLNGEKEAKK